MIDYVAVVRNESERFGKQIREADTDSEVPSCPGWTVADLAWHLAEVQHFWASIVEERLLDPDGVPDLDRPPAEDLPALYAEQSTRLIAALEQTDPDAECWSWHRAGNSVGWVRRRQAHEALIHRVDAELATGQLSAIDPVLATDGIDEILRVMLDASDLPEWASFDPTGPVAAVETTDGHSWTMQMGRFTGTSPNTGTAYDDPVLRLGDGLAPGTILRGDPVDIDLWLWGRGPSDQIDVTGDRLVVDLIRQAAVAGTQ
jgi:uncharacterized protein (TIGR03083 family)